MHSRGRPNAAEWAEPLASVTTTAEPVANRAMITVSILAATLMTAIDTTIANVALPHMAGSMSASPDQITWVLTSYIIASAIMTPTTGWLAGRIGRKQLFLIAIVGFTLASALCGAAQSLPQIVIFRLLQGVFGAALSPLSQAVLLDTYTLEERGSVMALWGMGVMVAPIAGPVLGGWLTDNFGWRWVFYINLPVGVLCALGVMAFVPERKSATKIPFDVMGFALLGIAMGAFQLFLDRGENKDWFSSSEIVIEASLAAVALVLFFLHTLTTPRPFLPIGLLRDRNFIGSTIVTFTNSMLVLSVLALVAPMTESLLGYPVITTGLVMAPRGIGAIVSMFIGGRLVGRVDNRLMIVTGLLIFSFAFQRMSHFSLQMDAFEVGSTGFIQGLGTGFVFMPTTTMAFVTLDPALRADATGVYTLVRNLGGSAGISIMQAMYTRNVQVVHSRLVEGLTPDNPLARAPYLAQPFSLHAPMGMQALNGEVNRQASMVAYVDVYHVMFLITMTLVPLVLLLLRPARSRNAPAHAAEEEALAAE
jgi:DHA2 family multidrug resistance protein